MSQTLSGYITEVRRLLHDANGNFYTDTELTDYINDARERLVRDTGCLRIVQISQTPLKVRSTDTISGATPTNPTAWAASTALTLNSFVFSNIFIYQVTQAGTTGTEPPAYPASNSNYPPTTQFLNGTVGLTYVGNCENIYYASLPQGLQTLDVLNINLYWGNTRVPMRYMPWTQFNAELRFWQNYIGRPISFTVYGQSQIFISPVPDQIYQLEIDTTVLPSPLVAGTDQDTINSPYTSPVAFYAAYKAKYKEQSFGEAEIFKQEYIKQAQAVLNSVFTRRIPDPYSTL
jgi:hypothetical protein